MNLRFMNRIAFLAAVAVLVPALSNAQEETSAKVTVGGFIRNYSYFDSKTLVTSTNDLFSYIPLQTQGDDTESWHMTAMTSRLWVDAKGYRYGNMTVSARIEADFYNGISGVTGTANLRLRQAFVTLGWVNSRGEAIGSLKVGQAWHPMAADMPDVISLNTGAPFNPFSRTPQFQWTAPLTRTLSYTAAAIWQMQYTSCGPEGASANYMKYGGIPELYLGVNYTAEHGLVRLGYDLLSLQPYKGGNREWSSLAFLYGQYKSGLFTAKLKTTFGQDGSHLNLTGGYAVTGGTSPDDYEFTPTVNSSTWVSLSYGKKWQGVLFGGYIRNFGTREEVTGDFWFCKNSFKNVNRVWRLTPTVIRNLGKVQFALEYELTGAQYGNPDQLSDVGLFEEDLKWVTNQRLNFMVKYTF